MLDHTEACWTEVHRRLHNYALERTHNADKADDVAQIVSTRLLTRFGPSDLRRLPHSYLRRCVANAIVDDARRHRVRLDAEVEYVRRVADPATPDEDYDVAEQERNLVKAIVQLPGGARTCFVEVDLLGTSIKHLAECAGITT